VARGTATLRYLAPRGRANLTRQARIKHPREKLIQLGAAGWDLRCGTWLPAAQGTLYSYKGQGFLPGRTGLNPLNGIPLATRGLEEKPSSHRQGTGIIRVCENNHKERVMANWLDTWWMGYLFGFLGGLVWGANVVLLAIS